MDCLIEFRDKAKNLTLIHYNSLT